MRTSLIGRSARETVVQTPCRNTTAPKLSIIIRFRSVRAAYGSARHAMSAPGPKWPVMEHMSFHLLLGRTTRVMWGARLTFFIFRAFSAECFIPELLVSVCNLLLIVLDLVRTKQRPVSITGLRSSQRMWTYKLS